MKIDTPFSVEYMISFSGRTQIDGKITVTSGMIKDKIEEVLEKEMLKGHIKGYKISAGINKIEVDK